MYTLWFSRRTGGSLQRIIIISLIYAREWNLRVILTFYSVSNTIFPTYRYIINNSCRKQNVIPTEWNKNPITIITLRTRESESKKKRDINSKDFFHSSFSFSLFQRYSP